MALKLEDKKLVVEEVSAIVAKSVSVVIAEYRGLTVEQMTNLRSKARESEVVIRVVKNTLARKALQGSPFEDLAGSLVGPVVLAFSTNELSAAARVAKDFKKQNDVFVVKALSIGSGALDVSQLDMVAALPTYDEAIGKLMYVMKAPVEKLARTMTALKEQKESEAA
ncbi:50S ribosomal protein L10 [Thiomicrospira sp. R3]|uniref:50S ribosomal protein L10 n=1 Tax=Thiomicrospira sp. R3 TaxID=3035472 RepID=UPI00259B22B5|nr:50S ribosomal protein L10 [Thiomicrospira sp. R3]WFE69289.1 50S ribosomal protein L10 [Thiomicrospira sp. R3]